MKSILTIAALVLALATTASAAHGGCDSPQVWVPGHWQSVGCEQVWVPGGYVARPVTVVVAPQPPVTVVTVAPPPPTQTWVPERWVWTGQAWALQPGHWEVSPQPVVVQQPVYVQQPQPVYVQQPQVVHVHHYDPPPRVTFGVGVVVGGHGHHGHHGHGHHGHGGHSGHRGGGLLVGQHLLPKPPRHLPDPLKLFKHDPLGLIRR